MTTLRHWISVIGHASPANSLYETRQQGIIILIVSSIKKLFDLKIVIDSFN